MKIFRFTPRLYNTLFFEGELSGGGGSEGGDSGASTAITTMDSALAASSEATVTNTGASPLSPDTSGQSGLSDLSQVLAGIPETDDDLQGITSEQLVAERSRQRVLASAINELQPLAPFKPLLQRGQPEALVSRLDLYDQLFTPQTQPGTQLAIRGDNGFPLYTTTPFLESMRAKQAGFIEQHTHDLLYLPLKDTNGQVIVNPKTGEPETVLRDVFRQLGLNPDRYSDYKNIDTLLAQSGNAITAEDLKDIPEQFHEAFKSLPPSIRQQLWGLEEEARNFHLQERKEKLDRQAKETEEAEKNKKLQAQIAERDRQVVVAEQNKFISEKRLTAHTAIMNDLDRQVTFSGDEKTNTVNKALIGSFITSLLEEDFDFATSPALKALGIELNGFRSALNTATTENLNFKLYELGGQGMLAEQSATRAYGPEQQVITKAAQIALDLALALGAQRVAKSAERDRLLGQAGAGRPIPDGAANELSTTGLPKGMRADSPEANAWIMQNIRQRNAAQAQS